MLRVRAVFERISGGTTEQKEAALWAVAPALLLGTLPLLLTALLLIFVNRLSLAALGTLFLDGELLVLTNAIVATSAMLIGKGRKDAESFPGGEFFILIGVLLLVLSTGCFVCIRMFDIVQYKTVNWTALGVAMILVFALGALYAYFLFLLDLVISPRGDRPGGGT